MARDNRRSRARAAFPAIDWEEDRILAVNDGQRRLGSIVTRGKALLAFDDADVFIGEVPSSQLREASRLVSTAYAQKHGRAAA